MPDFCPMTSARFPPPSSHKNGRLSEIEVGTFLVGTVCLRPAVAGAVIGVTLRELPRPQQLPRLQIEGEHGVAGLGDRVRVIVPRGNIERAPLFIDGGCRPDRGAGRALLLPCSRRLRWLRNRKALPDRAAGRGVERDNAAPERTTYRVGVRHQRLFDGREALVDDAFVEQRRSRCSSPADVPRAASSISTRRTPHSAHTSPRCDLRRRLRERHWPPRRRRPTEYPPSP